MKGNRRKTRQKPCIAIPQLDKPKKTRTDRNTQPNESVSIRHNEEKKLKEYEWSGFPTFFTKRTFQNQPKISKISE